VTKQDQLTPANRAQSQPAGTRPDTPAEDERPLAEVRRTVQDLVRMVSLHRWAFLVPCCVVASGAFVLSLYYPRTYRAVTSFERRNDPILVNLPNTSGSASFDYFRSTMVRDLTSPEYLEEVVDNIGLTKDFERAPDGNLTAPSRRRRLALASSLAETLRIDSEAPNKHMDIIWLRYTGPDANIGSRLLNELKKTYIRRTMGWIREFLEKQQSYYAHEAELAMEEVKLAEHDLTTLRLELPYADPQTPGSIATQMSQYELAREGLLARRREYATELSAQEQMLANIETRLHSAMDTKTEVFSHLSLVQDLDRKIENLKQTRGMTLQHPEVQGLLSERRRLLAELDEYREQRGETTVTNVPISSPSAPVSASAVPPRESGGARPLQSEYAQLRVQIAAQVAKLKEIDIDLQTNARALAELMNAKETVHERQEEYADIVNRVNKAKRRHGDVLRTLESIEPAIRAVEQDRLLQFTAGSPARGSSYPVNPQARTIVLLAILAGLGAGAVFVILAELLDHVFHNSGQVARSLGLPILESIDEIVTTIDRRRQFMRRVVVVPIALSCCLGFVSATGFLAYVSIRKPWVYERIKAIPRSTLEFLAGNQDGGEPEGPSSPNVA